MSADDGLTPTGGVPKFLRRALGSASAPPRRSGLPRERSDFYGGVHELVARRVYREFLEMPDLRVTLGEARRLFGLADTECAMVLECLTEFGLLSRLPNGRYARRVE